MNLLVALLDFQNTQSVPTRAARLAIRTAQGHERFLPSPAMSHKLLIKKSVTCQRLDVT